MSNYSIWNHARACVATIATAVLVSCILNACAATGIWGKHGHKLSVTNASFILVGASILMYCLVSAIGDSRSK